MLFLSLHVLLRDCYLKLTIGNSLLLRMPCKKMRIVLQQNVLGEQFLEKRAAVPVENSDISRNIDRHDGTIDFTKCSIQRERPMKYISFFLWNCLAGTARGFHREIL